jgi:hypothetical protein
MFSSVFTRFIELSGLSPWHFVVALFGWACWLVYLFHSTNDTWLFWKAAGYISLFAAILSIRADLPWTNWGVLFVGIVTFGIAYATRYIFFRKDIVSVWAGIASSVAGHVFLGIVYWFG